MHLFLFFYLSFFFLCLLIFFLQKNGRHGKSAVCKRTVSSLKICRSTILRRITNGTTQNIRQPAAVLINIVSYNTHVRTNDRADRVCMCTKCERNSEKERKRERISMSCCFRLYILFWLQLAKYTEVVSYVTHSHEIGLAELENMGNSFNSMNLMRCSDFLIAGDIV